MLDDLEIIATKFNLNCDEEGKKCEEKILKRIEYQWSWLNTHVFHFGFKVSSFSIAFVEMKWFGNIIKNVKRTFSF